MKQTNESFNEYDTTIEMLKKYILTNTIQVTMAETRFYKNLAIFKRKTDKLKFTDTQESMLLKAARFRIYHNDSGAVYSHAEKVRKAEEVKAALEEIRKNSATKHELNNKFKEWKEHNASYNEIMIAIGESQIEKLHELGLSLDKLTSQKEGFEHVKVVLENAVEDGKISPEQVMSYKLGTWRYLSAPKTKGHAKQKNAKLELYDAPSFEEDKEETTAALNASSFLRTPEALLAAKVTLEKIIKRCGYPEGTPVQNEKIVPLLNLAETKGFITKEERPAFEKALQPLIGAASATEEE